MIIKRLLQKSQDPLMSFYQFGSYLAFSQYLLRNRQQFLFIISDKIRFCLLNPMFTS